jgi:hypothetical protein
VPSYASMVATMTAQHSDVVDKPAIGRYWSERFVEALSSLVEARARRPERFVDVHFKAMLSEPLQQAQGVLAELGMRPGPDDVRAFEAYLQHNRQQRHGSHTYTPEDFGLSVEQLETDFAFYTEAYL